MTTNQAFIKAYRKDAPQAAPVGPTKSVTGRPTVAVPATHIEYVSVGAGQFAASYDTRTASPTRGLHQSVPNVVLPREGLGANSIVWPTCEAPFGRVDAPTSANKRPLSAYTAERRSAQPGIPDAARGREFQPATTVASFSWPGVCRILSQQCGRDFDGVANLLTRHAGADRSVVGVIGLFRGVGSTTTLLCLAARMASRGRHAIVVEGSFTSPRLATWLDAVPTAWWQDVLEHGVPLSDAVIRATENHIDLLPLGIETTDPLRLAGSPQAASTADVLRTSYDAVLVDLGAYFDPESQPLALELVRNMRIDAALVVSGPGGADPRDLAAMAEHLGQYGCELLGTIENRTAIL